MDASITAWENGRYEANLKAGEVSYQARLVRGEEVTADMLLPWDQQEAERIYSESR